MKTTSPAISVYRDGDCAVFDDIEIAENGLESVLRRSWLDAEAAIRIGRELVRIGMEIARDDQVEKARAHYGVTLTELERQP